MAEKSPLQPAKSGRAGATLGLGCAIPFGGVFFCVGCFALWSMTLAPLGMWLASRSWQRAEAVVISSELAVSDGDDGDTYRVAIRYRYDWPPRDSAVEADPRAVLGAATAGGPGRTHESDRYDFSHGSTNIGVDDMRAVIATHPPGARVTCFVDPADPASAVIDRSLPLMTWIGLGFSCPFIVAGLGVIGFAWHARRKKIAPVPAPDAAPADHEGVETKLACAESRVAAMLGLALVAIFWNGIVSVFVIIAVKEFGRGFIGWFLPIFLIPFVCVGATIIAALARTALRFRTPPAEVWIEPARPRPGDSVSIRWRLRSADARRLRVKLRVLEKVSGSDSSAEADLHRETLLETEAAHVPAEGRLTFTLPTGDLHPALESSGVRFVWELGLEGDTPRSGGFDDRFHLPVAGPEIVSAHPRTDPIRHPGRGVVLWTATNFTPGEPFVFSVERESSASPEPIAVRLGWFVDGPEKLPGAVVWNDQVPALAPGEHRTFETRLPLAPWSVNGSLIALRWRLEVVDRKQRPLAHANLVIAPDGQILRLRPSLPETTTDRKSWWRDLGKPTV